jgi:hypothetical protein
MNVLPPSSVSKGLDSILKMNVLPPSSVSKGLDSILFVWFLLVRSRLLRWLTSLSPFPICYLRDRLVLLSERRPSPKHRPGTCIAVGKTPWQVSKLRTTSGWKANGQIVMNSASSACCLLVRFIFGVWTRWQYVAPKFGKHARLHGVIS